MAPVGRFADEGDRGVKHSVRTMFETNSERMIPPPSWIERFRNRLPIG